MTNSSGSPRRLSRKKRLVFGLAAVLISLPVVELISWVAIVSYQDDAFLYFRSAQDALSISGADPASNNETIHPYLGWVMNPRVNQGTELGGRRIPVNALGLNDDDSTIPRRGPDRLIVGVLGGSVAWQMTVLGEAAFRDALRENPAWRDKQIRIVRLAMSGYKQPQQLMALNYLLSLGAEFDVIVNIDGYNEMALGVAENNRAHVFAAYPRMWHARMHDVVEPRTYSASYRLLEVRGTRQELAQGICNSWFRWSCAYNLVWKLRDAYWEHELVELASTLHTYRAHEGRGFAAEGPLQLYANETEMFDQLCGIWKNSSTQLHYLCQGNATKYLHVLQPNQYLPGSSTVPDLPLAERKKVFDDGQGYGLAIAKGYPLLIREGARLRERGVDFYDMTMLFAGIDEPIYADPFCHYNQLGNEMLARAVAGKIIAAVAATD